MVELGAGAPTLVDLGPRIGHLSFSMPDLSLARRELLERRVEAAWGPRDLPYGRDAGFRDADGLLFRILEPAGDLLSEQSSTIPPAELRLHHVSFLTRDVCRAEAFYAEMLGLSTVFRFVEEGPPKLS
jgi:catechol 2,3-dioxygenase-like lactoylglutathione lyase family enzyme